MSITQKPILYSYFRSSCSWRVRIVLALKKIDYEYKEVNLIKDGGAQFSNQYKVINPFSEVPALIIKKNGIDHILTQSLAIIDYLEHLQPSPSIYPTDPLEKAQALSIAEMINSGIQPLQNLLMLNKIKDLGFDSLEWAKTIITTKFEALEQVLKVTSGLCCVKDNLSIADVALIPQVFNAKRYGVDLNKFPKILKIASYLENHDAFVSSHPSNQPDSLP